MGPRFSGFSSGDRRGQGQKETEERQEGQKGQEGRRYPRQIPKPAKAAARKVKEWTENPVVAHVVAAALVATASALKDSKKAQRLAAEAGDELEKLSKKGAERGNALWQMALEIGRRSLKNCRVGFAPRQGAPQMRQLAQDGTHREGHGC
jgi:hypothetical protein